jgi:putative membrane protein insertion efficiency factor
LLTEKYHNKNLFFHGTLFTLIVLNKKEKNFVNSMSTAKQIASFPFIAVIKLYQWILSPWLGPSCRYTPTCSQYGLEAFKKYGPVKGLWLTIKRISRCHPWGGHGHDPVP